MSANSTIQWTEKTWNPVRGCSVVSPGCVNCYAMKQAHRFGGMVSDRRGGFKPGPYHGLTKLTSAGPQWTGQVRTIEDALIEPLKWREPKRVFVNSMSDLFHEGVPFEFIDRVFATMALACNHTFQILTKRAERMREYCARRPNGGQNQFVSLIGYGSTSVLWSRPDLRPWPLPNVWLGVSVENEKTAHQRIPQLIATPATVRFVSLEPLLEGLMLDNGDTSWLTCTHKQQEKHGPECCLSFMDSGQHFRGIDWVIVGGESGPRARDFNPEWARSIVNQCRAAGVPVFVKQLGSRPVEWVQEAVTLGQPGTGAFCRVREIRDSHGGDMAEWPADLRVREFPSVEAEAIRGTVAASG